MFVIRIFNLDVGSYLCMTTQKVLAKVDKDNKDKYVQSCLDHRNYFTPMVYSADRIPGADALAA